MLTFHKILFPVDFSMCCSHGSAYVARIAKQFGSEIVLLHAFDAYDPFGYGTASSTVVYGACEAALRQRREEALRNFGGTTFAGLSVSRIVELGEPADCVAEFIERQGVDLVFMPTHGRGKFRRLLLGSVTSKILHDAKCPVWTTAHSECLEDQYSEGIQKIICAIDLSPATTQIICAARDMAQRYGACVQLIHSIPALDLEPDEAGANAPFQRFLFDRATELMAIFQAEAKTNFEALVRYGQVESVVRDAASSYGAQLVVIGRGRLTGVLGRFRTNVNNIIREASCPVLSV
jgi:nucleotide-binding universal stress UspA family protein